MSIRSNMKSICSISKDWQSEFEGILLMKEKKSGYSEHWCRLKGNLLVFAKNADRKCEEMCGLILLECFSIEDVNENNVLYSFKLVFESGDNTIYLAAKSKDEYFSWKQHISEARCNGFTQKIATLREEVSLLQQQISEENDAKNYDCIDEGALSNNNSGLEISISCQDLPHYAIDTEPNPSVSIFITNQTIKIEKLHTTTEIIQNSRNPKFQKIVFVPETYFDPNFQIKFVVHDIRDIVSSVSHKIGTAEIFMTTLLNNSNLMMKLKNNSNQTTNSILRLQIHEQRSHTSLSESKSEIRVYYNLVDNNLVKSYCFPSRKSKDMRVVEMMGEGKFALTVPVEYLKNVFKEESLIQESLSRFGSNNTMLERLRTDRHIGIRANMAKYESLLAYLSVAVAQGSKFRSSSRKYEFELSFMPLNFHINRIYVIGEESSDIENCLDVLSVGVFTAHHLRFKNGGLWALSKNLPDGLNRNSQFVLADKMVREYVNLVQDISNQLKHLNSFISSQCDSKYDLHVLKIKVNKYLQFLQHQFFTGLSTEQMMNDYSQLILRVKDISQCERNSSTSLKLTEACISKFEQSVEEAGSYVINILWPKVLNSLSTDALNADWNDFIFREHLCFSQALAAVITGISLACNIWDSIQWSQMIICGVPIYFEGLLSTYGDENGMLEDMRWSIEKLKDLNVIVKPDPKAPGFNLISINRVEIYCYVDSWKRAPMEVRMKQKIKLHLHPYFFNVGINEQQTIANKMSRNALIHIINVAGYKSLMEYFERHVKNIGKPIQTCKDAEIIDCLKDLEYEIDKNRNKPVKVLRIVQQISWAFHSIRFTSCKSAKDRTAMGLTLEQIRWLKNKCEMSEEHFSNSLDCIRSTGLRRDNCYKNIKCNKYAFNAFQLLSFPKNYKAPVGTYGAGES